ncbi:3-isopropylmalate dehydratase small subunit [Halomicronema sp. CCY15110]|uniref:3-isopropylmalate dehydratase small subunit n=1 Tax=Halomicronema sp. CCY15110 TaxID=2767773 RepID=UPI0019503516|nr:3-isopropylmalate dehydratase small subunit [Halomicronema sp. CCY15110]
MSQVKTVSGPGLPLKGDDIDTDRIIPARFLKCVTFDGLGEQVFADDRTQLNGQHAFDQSQYQAAEILVVNRNFGCGSSREHAPQAISRWGIKALIGESFAEIFLGNCVAMGVPCVTVSSEVASQLQALIAAHPQTPLTLDLESMTVTMAEFTAPVALADSLRQMFTAGTWDATGQLVAQSAAVKATAANLPYITWQSA